MMSLLFRFALPLNCFFYVVNNVRQGENVAKMAMKSCSFYDGKEAN